MEQQGKTENNGNSRLETGNIWKLMLSLSIPSIIAQLVGILYNMVDRMFIGRIENGTTAMAALSVSLPLITCITAFTRLVGIGGAPLCAIKMGKKDQRGAEEILGVSFAALITVGVILTVVILVFQRPILTLFGADPTTLDMACDYVSIYALGTVFVMISLGMNSYITTQGFARTGMCTVLIGAILNIIFDAFFINYLHMGVKGAAIATVVSQVASALLTLRCVIGSEGMPWHVSLDKMRMEPGILGAICTIGIPAAAQSAMYNLSNMVIQSCMNSFGTDTIAAWGVYGKIDFVFWMTINSLGIAITTFVGQNFGARQYDRVRSGVRVCMAMAAGLTLLVSVSFYFGAEPLFRVFTQDNNVVAVGVQMMHVLTPVYITYISIEVLSGALRGCGDVRVPTLITVFFVCGLRMLWLTTMVPLYHTIATVEFSYPLTWTLASLLFILYYLRGGWLKRCIAKRDAQT